MSGTREGRPQRPDVLRAQRRARSMRGFKDEKSKTLDLRGPLKELGRAGVGVELYFRTLRWLMIAFVLAAALGSISLADNTRSNADLNLPIVETTIGPCCKDVDRLVDWQAIPWFITFLVFVGLMYFVRYKQRSIARLVDKRFTTTGDYAVEIRGVPAATREAELIDYFEKQNNFGKVAQVQIGYRCSEYVRLFERWKKLDIELRETTAQHDADRASGFPLPAGRAGKIDSIQQEMVALEGEMARLQAEERRPTGAAFIIFETEKGRRDCLRAHTLNSCQALVQQLGFAIAPRLGHVTLTVTAAPEPSDVYWENLEVAPNEVRKRSGLTLIVAAALVGVSAGLLALFTQRKNREIARLEARSESQAAVAYAQGISIVAACVVTGVNALLRIAVQRLTVYERRDTRTEYEESLFVKLSLAYVLNQSLLIILVSHSPTSWFVDGGVYAQAFFIVLANSVVPEFFKVFRIDTLFQRYAIAPFVKSQAKLDELWEPPEASMGEFYAGLLKTVALGLLYGPAMPVIYFVTAGALCITYGATKYALLRVCKQPPSLNEGVSERFREALSYVVLAGVVLQFTVLTTRRPRGQRDGAEVWPTIAFVLWALYKFVPVGLLPCCAKYTDTKSNDTNGAPFSSLRGADKYLCPISQPVPSIVEAQARPVRVRLVVEDGGGDGGDGGGAHTALGLQEVSLSSVRESADGLPSAPPASLQPGGAAPSTVRYETPYDAQPPASQPPGGSAGYAQPMVVAQAMAVAQAVPVAHAYPAPPPPPPPPPPPTVHAPSLLTVVCPENAGPGAQLIVQGPAGDLIRVTVPNQTYAGMVFHVSV
ncbi:hypothetical protein KFE25_007962 [Diacronema lutheri]|uniref:CSC1/OSCA1-like cytosolic domain-containing protein n=1 Tax=Diacronema lutheri TaxID=2081491 RepID=A0A8J6CGD0_DIALT|nr:hypothetical protein KFE25_007962 [Diacronema lutheri]